MKVRSKCFVHIYASHTFNEHSSIILAATDMSAYGYCLIGQTDIEIEVDTNGALKTQIRQIDAQIENVKKEAHIKVEELEQTKANLLSLEHVA
jgi:hypothetical protein